MTREEAIDLLDNLIGMVDDNHDSDYDAAIKMAIQALEQDIDLEVSSDEVEESAIFDADERADIMNAINDTLDDMGYVAVGYDDTNGVWMDVFIQKQ